MSLTQSKNTAAFGSHLHTTMSWVSLLTPCLSVKSQRVGGLYPNVEPYYCRCYMTRLMWFLPWLQQVEIKTHRPGLWAQAHSSLSEAALLSIRTSSTAASICTNFTGHFAKCLTLTQELFNKTNIKGSYIHYTWVALTNPKQATSNHY